MTSCLGSDGQSKIGVDLVVILQCVEVVRYDIRLNVLLGCGRPVADQSWDDQGSLVTNRLCNRTQEVFPLSGGRVC